MAGQLCVSKKEMWWIGVLKKMGSICGKDRHMHFPWPDLIRPVFKWDLGGDTEKMGQEETLK